MPFRFPSPEWASAYRDAINSSELRAAGATWTHGALAFVIRKDPAVGLAEDFAIWLELDRGQCREVRVVSAQEAATAPFLFAGDYARWAELVKRELDAVRAVMHRRIELTGNVGTVVRHIHAIKDVLEAAARVPSELLTPAATAPAPAAAPQTPTT